jgi:hypothetical protein
MTRIYHTWEKWECYPAGFYDSRPRNNDKKKEELEDDYRAFLADDAKFRQALGRVITEWKNSSEHYLSNECMNRIAWLGQASACIALGLPSDYRGGFNQLTEKQQQRANETALEYLNEWLFLNGGTILTMEEAQSKTEANIY